MLLFISGAARIGKGMLVRRLLVEQQLPFCKPRFMEVGSVPDQFTIRSVTPEDFPAWKELWDGYNAFYGREGPTALPLATTHMTWSRFFDAYEPMYALVADASGTLLGLAHYLFHRSTIQIEPTCYLQDLFTLEAARGKGVGRALIAEVCQRAQAAGLKRVYWQTHETNAVAMRLYDSVAERSGFVVYRCNTVRAHVG